MNEWNTKRTASAEAERLLADVNQQLMALRKRKDAVMEHLATEESRLQRKRNEEVYTHWYNGSTLRCLLHEYLDGWQRPVTTIPGQQPSEIERLQSEGLSVRDKVMDHE